MRNWVNEGRWDGGFEVNGGEGSGRWSRGGDLCGVGERDSDGSMNTTEHPTTYSTEPCIHCGIDVAFDEATECYFVPSSNPFDDGMGCAEGPYHEVA